MHSFCLLALSERGRHSNETLIVKQVLYINVDQRSVQRAGKVLIEISMRKEHVLQVITCIVTCVVYVLCTLCVVCMS